MGERNEIIIRENSNIRPNSFGIRLDVDKDKKKEDVVMVFGTIDNKAKKTEVMSEIHLNSRGLKAVFKGILDIVEEFKRETGIDVVEETLKESEKEGE